MKIFRANENDNKMLCDFFAEQMLSGNLQVKVKRNDFFSPYKLLTNDYLTLYLKDRSGQTLATASLLFMKGFVNNEEQTIGFATDLRVSKSRQAIQKWSVFFIPEFYKEIKLRNCKYVFSALELYENETYNALVRPRNVRREIPRYFLFRRFDRVFIHGFWPNCPKPITLNFQHAWEEDIPAISKYIMQKSIRKPLMFPADEKKLAETLKSWPNFKISDFILARDKENKIVGCVAPFRLNNIQSYQVSSYPEPIREAVHAINGLSWLGLTTQLPKVGQSGNLIYLSHLHFDNADIFYALINQVYRQKNKNEIITYEYFHGQFESRPPVGTICSNLPYGLFSVLPEGQELPEFLRPNPFIPAPDFPSYFLS